MLGGVSHTKTNFNLFKSIGVLSVLLIAGCYSSSSPDNSLPFYRYHGYMDRPVTFGSEDSECHGVTFFVSFEIIKNNNSFLVDYTVQFMNYDNDNTLVEYCKRELGNNFNIVLLQSSFYLRHLGYFSCSYSKPNNLDDILCLPEQLLFKVTIEQEEPPSEGGIFYFRWGVGGHSEFYIHI